MPPCQWQDPDGGLVTFPVAQSNSEATGGKKKGKKQQCQILVLSGGKNVKPTNTESTWFLTCREPVCVGLCCRATICRLVVTHSCELHNAIISINNENIFLYIILFLMCFSSKTLGMEFVVL